MNPDIDDTAQNDAPSNPLSEEHLPVSGEIVPDDGNVDPDISDDAQI